MDVVINDDMIFVPLPYEADRNLYVVESVAAVIQVKTTLDAGALRDALENLSSAMELRKKLAVTETRIMRPFEKATAELVRSFVFAFDQETKLSTLRESFRDFYAGRETPAEEQASCVGVLKKGIIHNFPPEDEARGVKIRDRIKRGVVAMETGDDTLLHFVTQLFLEMPKMVYRPPVMQEYLGAHTYPTLTD